MKSVLFAFSFIFSMNSYAESVCNPLNFGWPMQVSSKNGRQEYKVFGSVLLEKDKVVQSDSKKTVTQSAAKRNGVFEVFYITSVDNKLIQIDRVRNANKVSNKSV